MRTSSSQLPSSRTAIESDSSTPGGNCTARRASACGGGNCTPIQMSVSTSACKAYSGAARPSASNRSASASGSSCRPAQSATGPHHASTRASSSSRNAWSTACFLSVVKKKATKYSAINSWQKLNTLSALSEISSVLSANCNSCAISSCSKEPLSRAVNGPIAGCSSSQDCKPSASSAKFGRVAFPAAGVEIGSWIAYEPSAQRAAHATSLKKRTTSCSLGASPFHVGCRCSLTIRCRTASRNRRPRVSICLPRSTPIVSITLNKVTSSIGLLQW